MFFEPAPAQEDAAIPRLPEFPPWSRPPAGEAGVVLAVNQAVARSTNVAVFLQAIRAFSSGCMLQAEIITRQAAMPDDDWWDLQMEANSVYRGFRGPGLPDRLLRLGVRYPDGGTAATLDRHRRRRHDGPPDGPLLSYWPGSSGGWRGGADGSGELGFSHFGLWLWPLPPARNFEFAVEWPLGGIDLTICELDGAAVTDAARRPVSYWPE